MAEFPTYEQMAKNVAEKALDEFLYDGKSIREWMKIIAEQEPKTDVLDKIRAEIEQNAYPIVHGVNNLEKGMTLYGILQIIDKYRGNVDEI